MQFNHINISAPKEVLDIEKDFLCRIFRLTDGYRPKFSRDGYWLYANKQAIIHLTESDHHQPTERPSCLDHVAFSMTGLTAFVSRLEVNDVNFNVKFLPELAITQVFFKSPAGVGLEISFEER